LHRVDVGRGADVSEVQPATIFRVGVEQVILMCVSGGRVGVLLGRVPPHRRLRRLHHGASRNRAGLGPRDLR
jgi:hypothetical protein